MAVCSSCGAPLDARSIGGQCPRCLVALGFGPEEGEADQSVAGGAGEEVRHATSPVAGADGAPPWMATSAVLEPGTRLAGYRVLGLLGRGGMGEVYRARDGRLGREVAVKLLPAELGARPDMLARFEREARVLASLNHPNIATLFGFENEGERRFLVMELVDGETLADRLAGGPLLQSEALAIFRDVARGLAAAHDKGVVHRDLKPSNIALAGSGAVKVLDFGLAKPAWGGAAMSPSRSISPTLPLDETAAGVLVGTASYMSPEQARGREVDRRTDVWSLGCCLYESLTGVRAFGGDSVAEILAAVLKEEPDWSQLDRVASPGLARLVQRLLAKDPVRRPRDLADTALELEEMATAETSGALTASAPGTSGVRPRPSARRRPRTIALAAGSLLAALAAGWALSRWLAPAMPAVAQPVRRFAVAVGEAAGGVHSLALSPDGRLLVLAQNAQGSPLLLARLDRAGFQPLAGTESGEFPFVSPDGDSIAFFTSRENHLKKIPVDGGRAVVLAEGLMRNWGGSWSDDGSIVFNSESGGGGLSRVAEGGGEVEVLTVPDRANGEDSHRWPQVLPGGDRVLFTIWKTDGGGPQVALYDVRDRSVRPLVAGLYGRYLRNGHLAFFEGSQGSVAPFDVEAGVLTGPARPIESFQAAGPWGYRAVAFTDDGLMVRAVASLRRPVWVDRDGHRQELESMPPADYQTPSLSRAGDRLAVAMTEEGGSSNIWIHDLATDRRSRLTLEGENTSPVWVDDDRAIVFWSERGGLRRIYRRPVDGGREAEPLLAQPYGRPVTTTPDGRFLATNQAFDIWLVPLAGGGEPTPLLRTEFVEGNPAFSPDGRWFAYVSDESGSFEVYVRPVDGSSGRVIVSRGAETDDVIWSPRGDEILYRSDGRMFAVALEWTRPDVAPRVGSPVALFPDRFILTSGRDMDLSRDGRRLLMLAEVEPAKLVFFEHWFEALAER